jgi:Astacin (Peptidase family M12A)
MSYCVVQRLRFRSRLKIFIINQHKNFVVDSNTDTYGEPASSDKKGTAYISGVTFGARKVEYEIIEELAVFEGDIILGNVEDLERSGSDKAAGAVGRFRWPNGVVPFTFAPDFSTPNEVHDAINHWHANTAIRFIPRTNEVNYVTFTKGTACQSYVGMQGWGQQPVYVDGCSSKLVRHELGHAVGLFHEQSRRDRNPFVRINYENVMPGKEYNFDQYVVEDGEDLGEYDYCSIMHYGTHLWSKNNQPTITVLQPNRPCGTTIGQQMFLAKAIN